MTFARLRRADWVALLAALAVLLATAVDWYSTEQGQDARRLEDRTSEPSSGQQGEIDRSLNKDARTLAEDEERNAWQADAAVDRLILLIVLAAVALAIAAAFLRAAGRRFDPPLTPSALAAVTGIAGVLAVTYRIVQEPGLDNASTIEIGAPLAVLALGMLAFAAARGLRNEEEGEPFSELPQPAKEPEPAAQR